MKCVLDLCRGLAYLHGEGWGHGNVKPENLLKSNEAASYFLGRGGFGCVWGATHPSQGEIAVKEQARGMHEACNLKMLIVCLHVKDCGAEVSKVP